MILDLKAIQMITKGALNIVEKDGAFRLDRMTDAQKAIYEPNTKGFFRAESMASVHFDFYTDSESISFEYCNVCNHTTRPYFFFDIFEGDALVFHEGYQTALHDVATLPQGEPDGVISVPLSKGKKRVRVFFPSYFHLELKNVTLDDGAEILPYQPSLTITAFGDSITEAYDSDYPSFSYINQFADSFDAEVFNQGIGGERFLCDKIVAGTYRKSDVVTVAYGTNDFRHSAKERFDNACPAFFKALYEAFPDTPVFVLLPIWRKNESEVYSLGTLDDVRRAIRAEAEKYSGFEVIDCHDFMPRQTNFFRDEAVLHPNDLGHTVYARKLYIEILARMMRQKNAER